MVDTLYKSTAFPAHQDTGLTKVEILSGYVMAGKPKRVGETMERYAEEVVDIAVAILKECATREQWKE